jgi:hypothetical protein
LQVLVLKVVSSMKLIMKKKLFHIRVISKHTKIDTLFDTRSQANLIFEDIVKKLHLETTSHPKPSPLG